MGVLIGFAIMCYLVYLWMSKMKNRIDRKEYVKKEQERQMELARGRAIKKRLKEEKELDMYRQGIYDDNEEEEDEELFKEYDE